MTEEPLAADQNYVDATECKAFKAGAPLAAPSGPPQPSAAARPRLPIQELVRRPVLDHIPYALYASYPATDTGALLAMLDDPAQAGVWRNVVRALGIMGDARAAPRLIALVRSAPAAGVDPDRDFHTRVAALFALGYVVNRTGDTEALTALRDVYTRGPAAAALAAGPEELRREDARTLRITAGWGLALSGAPAAGEVLRQPGPIDAKRDPGAVTDFLATHAKVSRGGLAAYYGE